MYEITFDLPYAGLVDNVLLLDDVIPDTESTPALGTPLAATLTKDKPRRYCVGKNRSNALKQTTDGQVGESCIVKRRVRTPFGEEKEVQMGRKRQ